MYKTRPSQAYKYSIISMYNDQHNKYNVIWANKTLLIPPFF
jgi:hypothetical protein